MKRVLPNPEFVHRPGPQMGTPIAAHQPSLPTLPLEIMENIFEFLEFKDTCSTLQSYQRLYCSVRLDNRFWERFFWSHFSFPRVAPQENWLKECEIQDRSMYNIITGRCTVNEFKPHGVIACFARDEKGRFIVGFINGEIAVCDPKTGERDELCNLDPPQKILTLGGLYAVQYKKGVCVWELATQELTFSFEAQGGEFDEEIEGIDFMDGRLVIGVAVKIPAFSKNISDNEPTYIINIFDLKSKKDPIVWPFRVAPVAIALYGKTLACAFTGQPNLCIWDLESKKGRGYSLPDLAIEPTTALLEMSFFSEKILFSFNAESSGAYRVDADDPFRSRYCHLWEPPGFPDGCDYSLFSRCLDYSLPCSTNELSFLFRKCIPQQFAYWERNGSAPFKKFLPEQASMTGPWIFDQRQFSFLSEDGRSIFSLDFTASKEEVLRQIVKRLEAGDETSLNYARIYLKRMQQPVQDAIWSIYESLVNQQEEGIDLECLKESIQYYLMSISSE
jgi:hypothetical protein